MTSGMCDMLDVSIIIVNFNTAQLLGECIRSIKRKTANVTYEIIVSDNASTDGSLEMLSADFPDVILVKNPVNVGFGKANNNALRVARGKYVFYLNSDTVLLNNAVQMFFDYWEKSVNRKQIGALGCNLLDKDGKITDSYGDFFSYKYQIGFLFHIFKKSIRLYSRKILHIPYKKKKSSGAPKEKYVGNVDIIIGAALFVMNNDYARFDERFFLYHEEADMQYRMNLAGLDRLIIDGPEIIHYCGGSNAEKDELISLASISRINDYLSRVIYMRKNHNSFFGVLLMKLIVLAIWLNPCLFGKTKKYFKGLLSV